MVQPGADGEPTAENEGEDGASEGTIGADASARGRLVSMPAVRLADVIARLDEGDVEGARAILAGLLADADA